MSGIGENDGEPPAKKQRSEVSEGTASVSLVNPKMSVSRAQNVEETGAQNIVLKSKGAPRPVVVATTGNIRPTLIITCSQSDVGQKPVPMQSSSPSDSKMMLQFTSTPTLQVSQSKSPVNLPAGVTLASTGSPRFPTPQFITLPTKSPVSPMSNTVITRPVTIKGTDPKLSQQNLMSKVVPHTELQNLTKSGEQVKLSTGQTQFSFQVPLNWSTQGTCKSLLDTSKVSLVSFNPADPSARSLLQTNVTENMTSNPVGAESPKMTLIAPTTASQKTLIAGNKVIGNLGAPCQLITSPAGVISVTRPTTVNITQPINQRTMSKGNSFLISNKQYTIVPSSSNQVVTQLVKTDTKNKGKVTMAEAQILLPSGPAKISWPIHSQTTTSENKPILITSPATVKQVSVSQGKTILSHKPASADSVMKTTTSVSGTALVPTAKVVEVISPNKVTTKTNILPAQKNWELVKQSSQLLPQKQKTIQTTTVVNIIKDKNDSRNGSYETDKEKAIETDKEIDRSVSVKNEKSENNNNQDLPNKVDKSDSYESKTVGKEESSNRPDTKKKTEAVSATLSENVSDTNGKSAKDGDKVESDNGNVKIKTEDKEEEKRNSIGETETKKDQEDFNPVDAMNWKNGIGELPGSSLKMNDLGGLEVVTDGLECDETLNTSDELDKMDSADSSHVTETKEQHADDTSEIKQEFVPKKEVSNKDQIAQCENCANYGFLSDFYKDGRFCSQTCVNAFSGRHMRDAKKHGNMSKVILGMKKGRKKILCKDGAQKEAEQHAYSNAASKKNKSFVWTRYLEQEEAVEAPARLFKNPFPSVKNYFRVGMKLEGIDPNHQSKFCVLSVAEVCGYRVRLHFDGYSECYDIWSDIDSPYIFPVGFCEKNNKVLQPAKGFTVDEFSWMSYLKLTKAQPAPKSLFSNQPVQSVTPNQFRVGCKMEAIDKKNSSLICVASVADTMGDKVLVHFDSWEDNYDYWCDMTSPLIHPIGYCDDNDLVLSPPQDWHEVSAFTWEKYLAKSKSQAVPPRAFKPRQEIAFEPEMKVEVVDKRNPLLVRVATIAETENYMVKIHFDGWADMYDYWLEDDSPDIHPPGWCAKTGHPLVPPITPADLVLNSGPGVCPTAGCKGIGHIKGPKYSGHHSTFGCPYSEINMNKESVLADRLGMLPRDDGLVARQPGERAGSPDSKRSVTDKTAPNGDIPKKFGRGRKPKSYYLALEEQKAAREKEKQENEENLRLGIHNSVFSSSMITTPKTEVPLCWEQHCKLLPGVTSIRGNEVSKWTIDQVADFINTLPGCEEQSKIFKEEQIDGEAFLLLTQSDIVKIMNIKLGPALKIFNSIIMFKNSVEV